MFIRSLNIELTNKCYLRCRHCYLQNRKDNNKYTVSLENYKKTLEWAKDNDVIYIVLTGGDPLFLKNFNEYYMCAKRMGFIVSVLTNGLFIDSKIINLFHDYPPLSLEVSIYGMSTQLSTFTTQVKVDIDVLENKILEAHRNGIHILCKYIVCEYNKADIDKFISWVTRNSIDHSIEIANIPVVDYINNRLCYVRPSSEDLNLLQKNFPNEISVRSSQSKLMCSMPNSLSIDSNLVVRGCAALEVKKEKLAFENSWEYYSDRFTIIRSQSIFCPAWEQYESTEEISDYLQCKLKG